MKTLTWSLSLLLVAVLFIACSSTLTGKNHPQGNQSATAGPLKTAVFAVA